MAEESVHGNTSSAGVADKNVDQLNEASFHTKMMNMVISQQSNRPFFAPPSPFFQRPKTHQEKIVEGVFESCVFKAGIAKHS